jgi:hypothetical protein
MLFLSAITQAMERHYNHLATYGCNTCSAGTWAINNARHAGHRSHGPNLRSALEFLRHRPRKTRR